MGSLLGASSIQVPGKGAGGSLTPAPTLLRLGSQIQTYRQESFPASASLPAAQAPVKPARVAGACCGLRWEPSRHAAEGAEGMVAALHSPNRKVCFASSGARWPQQSHRPHLAADPSSVHAGEKPAGNSLLDQEAKPALLPARSWRALLPSSMHWEIHSSKLSLQRCWAGLCDCRHLAQGNGHFQGDGCVTASIPGELCPWGAQLLGPQGMHCVRASKTCVWMNRNALLQHGREDRPDKGILLGWFHPPAPTETPGTQPGAISQASIALNLCL